MPRAAMGMFRLNGRFGSRVARLWHTSPFLSQNRHVPDATQALRDTAFALQALFERSWLLATVSRASPVREPQPSLPDGSVTPEVQEAVCGRRRSAGRSPWHRGATRSSDSAPGCYKEW